MAWPSRNNQVDYSSLPQLHDVGNEDSTFYKETSATQAPFVTGAEPLSTEYGFYNPRVSLGAALLHPNSALPSTIAPFNLEYMDQVAMQGLPVQWNGTTEGPATNYHPLVENTVGVEALYSASVVQQPTPPKDSGIPTTRGHRARGRPAKKQE
ncbi:hypothetical protein LT330_005110 [Penicillium expansum]|nr:hypothetical protein LT330_005110 [Penicillium expansum]